MTELEHFGKIFLYKEQHYVYLGESPQLEQLYAARILNEENTQLLQKASDRIAKQGRLDDTTAYILVILTTKEFEGLGASLHETGKDLAELDVFTGKINEEDIKELKREIVNDPAIPKGLKEIITPLQNGDE